MGGVMNGKNDVFNATGDYDFANDFDTERFKVSKELNRIYTNRIKEFIMNNK